HPPQWPGRLQDARALRRGTGPAGAVRARAGRARAGREGSRGQREVHPFLGQPGDVVAGQHDLEALPVDLPVPQLAGPGRVAAEVSDMQPVAEIIQYQARLAVELADQAWLAQPAEGGG